MRYNLRYHIKAHAKTHRRNRWISFAILILLVGGLALLSGRALNGYELIRGFLISLQRVIWAYFISLGLAIVLALASESSKWLEGILLPLLDVAQSFPSFALLPILIYSFGKNGLSVVIILVIEMIWPILFNLISAIKEDRHDQSDAAKIFGAHGWKYLWHYRLPMLMPALMTGSIVSWGEAWDTIVGAEIIAGVFGAGSYLGHLSQSGKTSLLLLGIGIYLLLIFCINQLLWLPLLHHYTKYQAES